MDQYGVYHIYSKQGDGSIKAYKYGITKVGAKRPRSQLTACRKKLGGDCQWKWVREGVNGWRNAREFEAHHAARYRAKHNGRCPPGMVKFY